MIYLDNGATSYPKPAMVKKAVSEALEKYAANPGRSGHKMSVKTARAVYEARDRVASFFHLPKAENVIFTPSCTCALNMVMKGVLRPGDHVVISSYEHNAVVRPLETLRKKGVITYSVAQVDEQDEEKTLQSFRECINERTRLFLCTHASNVLGIRLPAERLSALAHQYQILFCMDAAQSGGLLDIDIKRDGYDFVCLAGHKGLYGPMGTGLLLINSDTELDTLIQGGTGSESDSFLQPEYYPDRMETGTQNIPGILGLSAGVSFLNKTGRENVFQKEMAHIQNAYNSLKEIKSVRLYTGFPDERHFVPVLSFNIEQKDCETVSRFLDERFGIATRAGLHCAPLAHRQRGSFFTGTVRISPSYFTTQNDILTLQKAVYIFSKLP